MCFSLIPAVALVLGGCASVGDFGRPRHSVFLNEVQSNYDKVERLLSPAKSVFVLSDNELDVRRAVHHFQSPLPTPAFPMKAAYIYAKGHGGGITPAGYADSLTVNGYADGNARAGQIDETMAADVEWLKRFESAAKKVRAVDQERLFVLEGDRGAFSDEDRINTHARITENADIMLAVLTALEGRITAYHYAIQRTRLEWPKTPLERTEMTLSLLREKAATLRVALGLDGSSSISFEEEVIVEPVEITPSKPRPPKMQHPEIPLDDDFGGARRKDPGSKSFL